MGDQGSRMSEITIVISDNAWTCPEVGIRSGSFRNYPAISCVPDTSWSVIGGI